MLMMIAANTADLIRIGELESQGYFKPGFSALALRQVNGYLARIWWLYTRRLIPGAPPYPGPIVTENAADSSTTHHLFATAYVRPSALGDNKS